MGDNRSALTAGQRTSGARQVQRTTTPCKCLYKNSGVRTLLHPSSFLLPTVSQHWQVFLLSLPKASSSRTNAEGRNLFLLSGQPQLHTQELPHSVVTKQLAVGAWSHFLTISQFISLDFSNTSQLLYTCSSRSFLTNSADSE